MKFKELQQNLNYYDLETAVRTFWKDNGIFEKSIMTRDGGKDFAFYDGPASVNGKPGIHHVFGRTIKDLICRYKTMRGFRVVRKGGWDTHGLPIEAAVEKQLGITKKSEIESMGVEEFNRKSKDLVDYYISDSREGWGRVTEENGFWVDIEKPYITCTPEYMESVWWGLKQIYDKGLIYKDYKIVPQDPKSESVMSAYDLAAGYREVKDPSIYVKFKLKDADEYFLVWTTTPWTLISNVALCVGPDVDYVKVKTKAGVLILAKARLAVLGEDTEENPVKILEQLKGADLEGLHYEPLFTYVTPDLSGGKKAFIVCTGSFVTTTDGSGIVHIAPAFGQDDYELSKKFHLPMLQPVTRGGRFTDEVSDFAGVFFKDADEGIIKKLKVEGKLFKKEIYTHQYPFSPRYDVPIIYYARDSWYIRTTEIAKKMIALNKDITWHPPEIGTGRFGNWLEENKDWALSRERFWGTPLPIWINEHDNADRICIGSIAELRDGFVEIDGKEMNYGEALDKGLVPLDLHKSFVDRVYFKKESKIFRRTPELVDVWFDSGAMPFAQCHYPFENKEFFDKNFPADFIAEGVDQTRGWFYSLHAIATAIFGKPAYKNVIVNDLILDKHGIKMSKSKGNVINPFDMFAKYGADAVRWYLVAMSPPWRSKSFNEDDLGDVQRKFFRALVNSYNFFVMYANVDAFEFSEARIPVSERTELDRWIISSLNTLIKNVGSSLDGYDVTTAARLIQAFTVDELSNWYIRRNRRRFWKGEKGADKTAAYQTLYECLVTLAKLMAPIAPFIADELYRNLNAVTKKEDEASVHLAYFPAVEETAIDMDLEKRMHKAEVVSSLVRTMREKSGLKVRQPLRRILLPVSEGKDRRELEKVRDIILDEVNVKSIEYVDDDSQLVSKKAKPNFKTLGKKFGKDVNAVAALVKSLTTVQIAEAEKSGQTTVEFNNKSVEIAREDFDVLREDIQGWLVASDEAAAVTVALDTAVDESLKSEGFAREFVSRIQTLRKDAGFDITDRIKIFFEASPVLTKAIQQNTDYVATETLATEISETLSKTETSAAIEDIDGEACRIALQRLN
jgi:isoleucyl-tRNA synthetase